MVKKGREMPQYKSKNSNVRSSSQNRKRRSSKPQLECSRRRTSASALAVTEPGSDSRAPASIMEELARDRKRRQFDDGPRHHGRRRASQRHCKQNNCRDHVDVHRIAAVLGGQMEIVEWGFAVVDSILEYQTQKDGS